MNEERDKSIESCTWILNTAGEILNFAYKHCDSDEESDRYESFGHDFCLPVPFEPGDIVLWDCHPFMEPMRVLILDIGDNRDCCDVQCLFMRSAEKIDYCPFAHLSKWIRENTYTSPLYRATRWQKKLPQSEAPLELLGAAIKTAPSFGLDIIRYIDAHGKCNANPLWNQGVEWKALLNECNMLKEKRIL